MRIWVLVLFGLLLAPFASAESVQLATTADTSKMSLNEQFAVTVFIDAQDIVGYQFDIEYDESLLTYDSVSFSSLNNYFTTYDPLTSNPGILFGTAAVLNPQTPGAVSGSAGTYVTFTFTTSSTNEGNTHINITNPVITNSTISGPVGNPEPTAIPNVAGDSLAVRISQSNIAFENPSSPGTVNTDGAVNITYSVIYDQEYIGELVVPPSNYVGTKYWLFGGGSIVPVNYANSKIELNLLTGNTYTLIQQINTPITVSGALNQNENVSTQEFSLQGPNTFDSVNGNITVNSSYPYVWLYQFNNSDWVMLNPTNLVRLSGNQVIFEDVEVDQSVEDFMVVSNKTCVSNWVWGACVGSTKTATDTNYCTHPYTQTSTDGCVVTDCTNCGGGGGGGGGGGDTDPAVEKEFTETYEFSDDVFEVRVTYMGYSRYEFKIDYDEIDLGIEDTAPYKSFELYSTYEGLTDDKVSEVRIKFKMNEFWVENNDIDHPEVYQKVSGDWKRLTTTGSGPEYTAYSNSKGTFVILGVLKDAEVQVPGEVEVKGGGDDNNNQQEAPEPFGFENFFLPIVIGVAILVLIVAGVVMSARHPAKHGNPKEVPKAKMEKVVDYVSKARVSGMTDEKIRANLNSVGWSKDVIDNAMNSSKPSSPGKPAA